MTLDQVLSNQAPDGWIYRCDVAAWLGEKVYSSLSYRKREDLINKLAQINNLKKEL